MKLPKHINAADPVIVRAPRKAEQKARPRGKGRATNLSTACIQGKHWRCCSLTCLCPCGHIVDGEKAI